MTDIAAEKLIYEGERVDDTGFGGLRLIQKPEEFCYGVDAVILADFAARSAAVSLPSRRRQQDAVTAVDLGTGTGIIPLILSHKTQWQRLIGVEVQEGSYGRAVRNARMNGLDERLRFIRGDVKDFGEGWGKELAAAADVVTSNPPYTQGSGGLKSANTAKAIARHETTAGLEDFIRCAGWLLKPRGDFFMVHRPSRLVDICCMARKAGLEPKEMCFVSPDRETAANILMVHMVKGGGRQLTLLDPLCVYEKDGCYSEKIKECYR